jgi:hypothetical protein
MTLTIEQRPNRDGFPKARELIEIRPSTEMTLQDRRVLNLLVENAGPNIVKDEWHEIALQKLRGPSHKGHERIRDSIKRLMLTLVEIPVKDQNGLPAIRCTAILSENIATIDEDDPRAILRYKFTETMRGVLQNSRQWGRIKGYIIWAFSSKYALALYEAVCLRINLQVEEQIFSVEEFRALLDVPEGSLKAFPNLKQSAITPAVREVNGLSDFVVEVEPLRDGGSMRGKLKGFRLSWRRKAQDEWSETLVELMRPKTGRKARISGTVEQVVF